LKAEVFVGTTFKKSIFKFFKNLKLASYRRNNENATKITIFSVTSRGYEKLRKTYEKITELKTKINKFRNFSVIFRKLRFFFRKQVTFSLFLL
jgi:DNA-binding PadR family transcriptional regulator